MYNRSKDTVLAQKVFQSKTVTRQRDCKPYNAKIKLVKCSSLWGQSTILWTSKSYSLLVGTTPHERSVLLPISSCQKYFPRMWKVNTASDSTTRGKCLLNDEFLILKITHWKKPSALPLTFKALIYSSKHGCNFLLTETEDKCFLMPTQCNKVDGRGQKYVYVVPHSTEIRGSDISSLNTNTTIVIT